MEAYGLKIKHNSRVSKILSNSFYCGIISHSLLQGEVKKGIHEKLISEEIFIRVNNEKGKIPHGYKADPFNDNLPLKLYAKCEGCSENLRSYLVKKKNLYYYKCDGKGKCTCNVSAKKLHKKFEEFLEDITLKEEYIELYKMELRQVYATLNQDREINVGHYKAKITELDNKVERLEERFINEEIKADLYYKHAEKLKAEREEFRSYLENTVYSTPNFKKYMERSLEYLLELPSVWASSDYAGKRKFNISFFLKASITTRKTTNLEPQK